VKQPDLTWWGHVGGLFSAAARGDETPETALQVLQKGLGLDAVLLSVSDPGRAGRYLAVASSDYTPDVVGYLSSHYALSCPGYAYAAKAGTPSRFCDTPFDFKETQTFREFLGPAGFREGITVPFSLPWTGQHGYLAGNSASGNPLDGQALVGLTLLSNAFAAAAAPSIPSASNLGGDAVVEVDRLDVCRWVRGGGEVSGRLPDAGLVALARYLRTSRRARAGFRAKDPAGNWCRIQGHMQTAPGAGVKVLATITLEPLPAGITERELDIMALVSRGMTNTQIAEALFVSLSTVKSHIESLLGKLGLENRSGLVAFAAADDVWSIRYFD
jgi:DNA-binding CsgD family transcriptional regulator